MFATYKFKRKDAKAQRRKKTIYNFFASLRLGVFALNCRNQRSLLNPLRLFFLCLILSSCGYRWHPEYPDGVRPTITVPFVIGDEEGNLTAEIVRALNSSGLADVKNREGDYRLRVTIVGGGTETVGFRRDRQDIFGKLRKQLLAA